MSFNQFYEIQHDRPSLSICEHRYDDYKADYNKANQYQFWKQHKTVSFKLSPKLLICLG